ncbi:MAG: hypothetical protein EOO52_07325 [Gammaproteobacteria bacterium]|nr:MAG: hypothetical protein EOO52_07325 [Gammaproteobacteria bacterium]
MCSSRAVFRNEIILSDIDELQAVEAAEKFHISIPALKSRLHRARALIREHLMSGSYFSEAKCSEEI